MPRGLQKIECVRLCTHLSMKAYLPPKICAHKLDINKQNIITKIMQKTARPCVVTYQQLTIWLTKMVLEYFSAMECYWVWWWVSDSQPVHHTFLCIHCAFQSEPCCHCAPQADPCAPLRQREHGFLKGELDAPDPDLACLESDIPKIQKIQEQGGWGDYKIEFSQCKGDDGSFNAAAPDM